MQQHHIVKRATTLTVAVLSICGASAADNLIINGGFETLPSGGTISDGYLNTTIVPGWTVTGDVDFVDSSKYWKPHSGSMSLDLNGYSYGSISQTVNIQPGTYKLSFWYAGNFWDGSSTRNMSFAVNGYSENLSATKVGDEKYNVNWVEKAEYFTFANSQPVNISVSFSSRDGGSSGPILDDVSFAMVPEPYQYGLASIFGLFGLAVADRVRQRKLNHARD